MMETWPGGVSGLGDGLTLDLPSAGPEPDEPGEPIGVTSSPPSFNMSNFLFLRTGTIGVVTFLIGVSDSESSTITSGE